MQKWLLRKSKNYCARLRQTQTDKNVNKKREAKCFPFFVLTKSSTKSPNEIEVQF